MDKPTARIIAVAGKGVVGNHGSDGRRSRRLTSSDGGNNDGAYA